MVLIDDYKKKVLKTIKLIITSKKSIIEVKRDLVKTTIN